MNKFVLGCLGLVVLGVLIFGLVAVGKYNTLVTMNETTDGAWAEVENNLQRRADLIPNLVETVKGFATQERTIFTEVAEARSKLAGAASPREAAAANEGLTSALGRLLAIVENYPQLKSDQNFIRLQDELAGTENRLSVARMRYNDAVRVYNTAIRRFPTNIVAGLFGFGEREYFEVAPGAAETPKVDFS